MTREEIKANELIDKFWQSNPKYLLGSGDRDFMDAIRYSIICVDEIIQALKTTIGHMTYNNNDYYEVQNDFNYWESIKQLLIDKLK